MRKRIFSGMLILTIISIIVVSITICVVFYMQISSTVRGELQERALMLKDTISLENFSELAVMDMRLTVISKDGSVMYDDDHDAESMSNHLDREEVRDAFANGVGESRRFSDTLGEETYYYAVLLKNGMVLRLAKTTNSIWGMFSEALPWIILAVLVIMALVFFFATRLTKRIVSPINSVDLEENLMSPYDELVPFMQTISTQREHIATQLADIQYRSDTIDTIMDSMSEGLILVDTKGDILSLNKSAADIFSVEDSPEGKNILEIFRDTDLLESMRSALSGEQIEQTLSLESKTYRVYFSPVTSSGAIILFLDITETMRTEKIRQEFSANVSHELKTPLTTIYGNAEMLENDMVKAEDTEEFYRKIRVEAGRLISLIDDIMMVSKLDEEKGRVQLERVSLKDIADEVADSLAIMAKKDDIKINVSGEAILYASQSQITEMFYNLLENAIKYNKRNGDVSVEIVSNTDNVKIIVEDNGIGIPKDSQNRVFERFFRVDKSRSKATGGTGLGLAIVKHIVMAHDGIIELESEIGKGTKITITLLKKTTGPEKKADGDMQ